MSSSNAVPFPEREPKIRVDDDEVVFDTFTERDQDVIDVLRDSDDVEHAAHTVLQIGARAVKVANASTDANVIEAAFDQLTSRFDDCLKQSVEQIGVTSDRLFADDGLVEKTLKAWKEEFDTSLDDAFDADSKKSVIAKVEQTVQQLAKAQRDTLLRLIDPTDDTSPLRKIQRDLSDIIKESSSNLAQQVQELSERIAVDAKAAEVFQLTTLKGATFEDLVHGHLSVLASAHGDTAEQTGSVTGDAGTKKGDEVVTLNCEDTSGQAVRVVYELKDRALGQAKVNAEADDALVNRSAAAVVVVFAKQEQAPTSVPFSYSGNRAIVVLDKDDPDPNVLRLAYMWSRWVARRSCAAAGADELDLEAIGALLERVATSLQRAATVKRGHTQSRKGLDLADEHLAAMEGEISEILEELRDELDR